MGTDIPLDCSDMDEPIINQYKLTVIFIDPEPIWQAQTHCEYRTVTIKLTPEQNELLACHSSFEYAHSKPILEIIWED